MAKYMAYWWNKNWTTMLEDGMQVYSEVYKSIDHKARAIRSFGH